MNDIVDNRGKRDATLISLDEEWQVKYWSTRFGVTEEMLKKAVAEAGNVAVDVQRHFGVVNKGRWKTQDKDLVRY